jgi:hypothetical protein
MLADERTHRTNLLIASTLVTAGLTLSVLSLVAIARTDVHLSQATQPLQASPPDNESSKPAESKPGGTRPTTPAPEPARPDPQAQKEGAKAALPPAPPEKVAPPMQSK